MAVFEGTTKEFMQFLGSYYRIKVNTISKLHKHAIGKCEHCHTTVSLEAAHIHGMERAGLIRSILQHYTNNGRVKVDLQEFDTLFVQKHEPLNETIKILCRTCHSTYDRSNPARMITANKLISVSSGVQNAMQVKPALTTSVLTKQRAMQLVNKHTLGGLNHHNTVFANPSENRPVWWLEPKNEKFKQTLHIILTDPPRRKFYYFHLPAGIVQQPKANFKQRTDKPSSSIFIPLSTSRFKDENGFDFTPYLLKEFDYPS